MSWTNSDSLYGSRHLATEMAKNGGMLSVAGKTAIEAMVCEVVELCGMPQLL